MSHTARATVRSAGVRQAKFGGEIKNFADIRPNMRAGEIRQKKISGGPEPANPFSFLQLAVSVPNSLEFWNSDRGDQGETWRIDGSKPSVWRDARTSRSVDSLTDTHSLLVRTTQCGTGRIRFTSHAKSRGLSIFFRVAVSLPRTLETCKSCARVRTTARLQVHPHARPRTQAHSSDAEHPCDAEAPRRTDTRSA